MTNISSISSSSVLESGNLDNDFNSKKNDFFLRENKVQNISQTILQNQSTPNINPTILSLKAQSNSYSIESTTTSVSELRKQALTCLQGGNLEQGLSCVQEALKILKKSNIKNFTLTILEGDFLWLQGKYDIALTNYAEVIANLKGKKDEQNIAILKLALFRRGILGSLLEKKPIFLKDLEEFCKLEKKLTILTNELSSKKIDVESPLTEEIRIKLIALLTCLIDLEKPIFNEEKDKTYFPLLVLASSERGLKLLKERNYFISDFFSNRVWTWKELTDLLRDEREKMVHFKLSPKNNLDPAKKKKVRRIIFNLGQIVIGILGVVAGGPVLGPIAGSIGAHGFLKLVSDLADVYEDAQNRIEELNRGHRDADKSLEADKKGK